MDMFLKIAGAVYTIIGTIAIVIVSGVYFAVKYFGCILTFGTLRRKKDEKQESEDEIDRGQMDREG